MVSWLITGSNRGIGLGFVHKLSADPANVVFAVTRNKSTSTDLLELESRLKNVHVLQADITDVPSLRNVAKEVEKVTGGSLDVLINNGAYLNQERADYTIEMYPVIIIMIPVMERKIFLTKTAGNFFNVNVLGVIKTINVFLPLLRKASQTSLAKVITIGSAAGDIEFAVKGNFDFSVPYAISKAAVNMATAKYAARFKGDNFLFLSLAPGVVNTRPDLPEEVQKEIFGLYIERFQAGYPEWDGKLITPEESVTAMLNVVSKLTANDSGKSLSQHGDSKKWL
ncbi:hypothetical protein QCA50_016714 [Cerrena zonata]|uniref:NAD(P)-binding protein n=1 Tax=Cerrena zonata TaxID=2478898 RepID=A0AAW0FF39_9APHY